MDQIGRQILWVAMVLPGFLTFSIVNWIVDVSFNSEFIVLSYSLAATLVVLVFTFLIRNILGVFHICQSMVSAISIALFFSITLGITISVAVERDVLFRALRAAPVTDAINVRSSLRPMIFLLSQNSRGLLDVEGDARPTGKVGEAWMRVVLSDGSIFEGWPEFYSSTNVNSEIYLSPACSVDNENEFGDINQIHGPGIIIMEREVRYVILLDRRESPCFFEWFPQE